MTEHQIAKAQTIMGKLIKQARIERGWTRDVMAEKIGRSPRFIAAIENEAQPPSMGTLIALVTSLGTDANGLFYPDYRAENTELDRALRMVRLCDERQLRIVAATLDAVLENAE